MFEVSIFNDGLRATHFIYFGGKLLFDTGIDSQKISWKISEFLTFYHATFWNIDQIIPP